MSDVQNKTLWQAILEYDLDDPPTEYSFSIRLATENFWTSDFTDRAILEYKKFMYLAATSDRMVSPSEIVDAVWHQHLVFTQSYQDFCTRLGKPIQHVPSTHSREEADRFKKAREHTRKLYAENFGEPPHDIWECTSMFDSLNLPKAEWKIRSAILAAILTFFVLLVPCYSLLEPLYRKIPNPDFLIGWTIVTGIAFLLLYTFSISQLKKDAMQFKARSFIHRLTPFELIYLKQQLLRPVITAVVNSLIRKSIIQIAPNDKLAIQRQGITKPREFQQALNELSLLKEANYLLLSTRLMSKPCFLAIQNSMGALKKYYHKSKRFAGLFYFNLTILGLLLMGATIRLITGLVHQKPVDLIITFVFLLVCLIILFLYRLTQMMCTQIIPNIYRSKVTNDPNLKSDSNWSYFLFGTSALVTGFVPLVKAVDRSGGDSAVTSSDSSCGSSCGSSCSSCGGCGGD
ncbi:MAG: hypothetical protein ACK5RG_05175 [Cyclobacteriaceae bacterium]|jgi:hypothetical protein